MSELIIAGFEDVHSALLAHATLARLRAKLSLAEADLAVISRGSGREVTLQEAIDLGAESVEHETFWKTLVNLLFAPVPSTGTGGDTASVKLAAIGIDATFKRQVAQELRPGTAALLVLVKGPVMRDGVVGVLRGFQ